MNPVIEAQGLERDFVMGDTVVRALRGVNIKIDPGEYVAHGAARNAIRADAGSHR